MGKIKYLFLLIFVIQWLNAEIHMDSLKLSLHKTSSQFYYQVINEGNEAINFNIHNMNNANLFKLLIIDSFGDTVNLGCGEVRLNYGFIFEHKTNYRKIYPGDTLSVMMNPPLCPKNLINLFIPKLEKGKNYIAVLIYEANPPDNLKLPANAFKGKLVSDSIKFMW